MQEFERNDWSTMTRQVPWAGRGWPGLAIVREPDGLRLWICAYDWTVDFGYAGPTVHNNTLGFIIGMSNLPSDQPVDFIRSGRHLSDCDFLTMEKQTVVLLARLFLDGKYASVASQLIKHEPVNRFS